MQRKYDKQILNTLINIKKLSYEEIGRQYGTTGSWIKKLAKKLEIEIPIRAKFPKNFIPANKGHGKHLCLNCNNIIEYYGKKFCSNECEHLYRSKEAYKKFLETEGKENDPFYTPKIFKKYFLQEQNNECAICHCEPIHNNKELVFVMDHIDGHCTNNKRENIRLICPNCDSQLDTYKSKNKHSDRTDRYNRLRQFGTIK